MYTQCQNQASAFNQPGKRKQRAGSAQAIGGYKLPQPVNHHGIENDVTTGVMK